MTSSGLADELKQTALVFLNVRDPNKNADDSAGKKEAVRLVPHTSCSFKASNCQHAHSFFRALCCDAGAFSSLVQCTHR